MILRSTRVIRSSGAEVAPASIHIKGGRIERVDPWHSVPDDAPVMELGDRVIMAGIVDSHVHVNEPGRTEWEGFQTATRAAAAGGVTTIMDMPLNSIPATTSVRALDVKRTAAEGKCFVDVGFAGGVVPGNAGELVAMMDAGVLAFKSFLCESGVDEFAHVSEEDLRTAMPILAERGTALLVHAELPEALDEAEERVIGLSPEEARRYANYLASRPRAAEDAAVELLFKLAKETSARTHVVHLSSADALATIRRARESGIQLGAETCPHYLTFASEDVPDGATEYKCAPPIRERENRERLWNALREGVIDQVVSDHSPATPALKCCDSGDFIKAWGGISSLELGLSIVWTGAHAHGLRLNEVARLLCEAPASLIGLGRRKGRIAAGYDADLVVWEPEASRVVDPNALEQRHKLTAYAKRTLEGKVFATILGGRVVFEGGQVVGSPQGRLLGR